MDPNRSRIRAAGPTSWNEPPVPSLPVHNRHGTVETVLHRTALATVLFLTAAACARPREYELRGQIIAVDPVRRELTIKHEDIRGFMPGMTMPFRVKDARLIEGRVPGDLVRATLVLEDTSGYLSAIERTGHAPLADAAGRPPSEILQAGDEVPDAAFVDQSGRSVRLSSWSGRVRAVTFVYTRCPLPDFCPLMDRQFAALQRQILLDRDLNGRVHLVSVSIDPSFDTPAVLAAHAKRAGADPELWTFLTGDPAEVNKFASRFGVSITGGQNTPTEIVHNLRTALIDSDGRLVRVFGGNDWTPAQVLAELKRVAVR